VCIKLLVFTSGQLTKRRSTIRSAVVESPVLHADCTALCFTEWSYCQSKVSIALIRICNIFGSCDVDLGQMTIYELSPYLLKIYQLCENERLMSRLSKVIAQRVALDLMTFICELDRYC